MLNKYEQFVKINKTRECSLYTARCRETCLDVLIKRIKTKFSWETVLSAKHMQYSQKCRHFPRMIEIFKQKGDFFIVYEKPIGHSLSLCQPHLLSPFFYSLLSDLSAIFQELKAMIPGVYIQPEWLFVHRNTIKIVHFEPFFVEDHSRHVYLYKEREGNNPEEEIRVMDLQTTFGLIVNCMLGGETIPEECNEEQQRLVIERIKKNAPFNISQGYKDKKLAKFIQKIFQINVFERPEFKQIGELAQRRIKKMQTNSQYNPKIQIKFQQFELEKKKSVKKLRNCCLQVEKKKKLMSGSIEKIDASMRQKQEQYTMKNISAPNLIQKINHKRSIFLPQVHVKKPLLRQKAQIKMTNLLNTTLNRPLMFRTKDRRLTQH